MRHWLAVIAATGLFLGSSMLFVYVNSQPSPPDQQSHDSLVFVNLDRLALEEAYHDQVVKLFGVWLKEGARDPTYFSNGLRNARRAYVQASDQIAKREQQLGR